MTAKEERRKEWRQANIKIVPGQKWKFKDMYLGIMSDNPHELEILKYIDEMNVQTSMGWYRETQIKEFYELLSPEEDNEKKPTDQVCLACGSENVKPDRYDNCPVCKCRDTIVSREQAEGKKEGSR